MVIATLLAANECCSSLDIRFDLHAASRRLIVVTGEAASFDVRSDFHTRNFPFGQILNIARRRHILGFEAEGRRTHTGENGTENQSRGGIIFVCVLPLDACVRGETGAKMRTTGGW
jgi:hypothetical protein